MGGKSGGSNEAAQARADEQARQAKIRSGTERINSIFDGTASGRRGTGEVTGLLDPSKTYYNADGSTYTGTTGPMSVLRMFAGGGLGNQPKLFSGVEDLPTTGFNDAYFNGRRDAYINYAQPQLDTQYNDAKRQLTFSLARSGTLDSSERARQEGVLQREYDTQRQGIADQGLSYSTQARNSVEDARANLVQTLNATGDAEGAANSAISRASALSQPAAFSPLGQIFSSFTQGLGTQAALERANAMSGGMVKPTYNTGLFGNRNSVRVT